MSFFKLKIFSTNDIWNGDYNYAIKWSKFNNNHFKRTIAYYEYLWQWRSAFPEILQNIIKYTGVNVHIKFVRNESDLSWGLSIIIWKKIERKNQPEVFFFDQCQRIDCVWFFRVFRPNIDFESLTSYIEIKIVQSSALLSPMSLILLRYWWVFICVHFCFYFIWPLIKRFLPNSNCISMPLLCSGPYFFFLKRNRKSGKSVFIMLVYAFTLNCILNSFDEAFLEAELALNTWVLPPFCI